VNFAVSYIDKHWNRAVDLDHRVKLDGALGLSESGPGKHRQTQIDGGGIQRVRRSFQIQPQICVGVERTSDVDERVREIGVDSPIPTFVRIGKRRSPHWSAEPAVIKLAALGSQTDFDVSKTLAIGQLGESHRKELIPTSEAPDVSVSVEALNATTELVVRKELHNLSEYGLSLVHWMPP
jgi:hypothetical protein